MSTPTRKPYLSDEDLIGYITTNGVTLYSQHRMSTVDVRDKYEAHLAEQEQTIADLRARVDAMQKAGDAMVDLLYTFGITATPEWDAALSTTPAQPLDPDAHITDQDAYLKANIERAKDVDFDGIEAERVDPAASHMEHCRTLVDAQPDETLADAIERLIAGQKSLSVDKIMEVYHEHERWFNLHGGAPAKRSGNFKARINKLLKTNERE